MKFILKQSAFCRMPAAAVLYEYALRLIMHRALDQGKACANDFRLHNFSDSSD